MATGSDRNNNNKLSDQHVEMFHQLEQEISNMRALLLRWDELFRTRRRSMQAPIDQVVVHVQVKIAC